MSNKYSIIKLILGEKQMTRIYFHEDDYCSIEILPIENLEFCLKQAGLIADFSEKHKAEVGYTDIFALEKSPFSMQSKKIPKAVLEKAVQSILPKFDEVFTGYGSYEEKCSHIGAFGNNENVVIFYDEKDGFIENIWLNLNVYEAEDITIAKSLVHTLSKLGNFIIADWGWGFIEALHNCEQINQYLLNRLEVFALCHIPEGEI